MAEGVIVPVLLGMSRTAALADGIRLTVQFGQLPIHMDIPVIGEDIALFTELDVEEFPMAVVEVVPMVVDVGAPGVGDPLNSRVGGDFPPFF